VLELHAIGYFGERVDSCEVADPLLCTPTLGDILRGVNPVLRLAVLTGDNRTGMTSPNLLSKNASCGTPDVPSVSRLDVFFLFTMDLTGLPRSSASSKPSKIVVARLMRLMSPLKSVTMIASFMPESMLLT
jgi:hypothetical protein